MGPRNSKNDPEKSRKGIPPWKGTLLKTNASHLKTGHPKSKTIVFQPSMCRRKLLVSGRGCFIRTSFSESHVILAPLLKNMLFKSIGTWTKCSIDVLLDFETSKPFINHRPVPGRRVFLTLKLKSFLGVAVLVSQKARTSVVASKVWSLFWRNIFRK